MNYSWIVPVSSVFRLFSLFTCMLHRKMTDIGGIFLPLDLQMRSYVYVELHSQEKLSANLCLYAVFLTRFGLRRVHSSTSTVGLRGKQSIFQICDFIASGSSFKQLWMTLCRKRR